MRFERDDAKIGLLVLGAALVFLGLVFHRSLSTLFKEETILQVRLENASGLDVGTEVQLQGHRVGQVNEIVLKREDTEYFYLATIGLRTDLVLWRGTIVLVSSNGIGSSYLALDLPPIENRKHLLEPGDVLMGESGASLGSLIAEVQGFVRNLNEGLDELRTHLKEKGLDSVLDHPNVRRVLLNLDGTLAAFRQTAVRGDALLKQGQGSVETLDRGLRSLEKSSAIVAGLLENHSGDIDETLKGMATLVRELESLSKDMNVLLKSSGPEVEGSLKSLHRNLKATEELLEILKNKPSRILWGTPSASEKDAARKKVEAKDAALPPPPPPPPSTP